MRIPPIPLGFGIGLLAVLALAPMTGSAIGRLSAARAERARLAAIVAAPERAPRPLVAEGRAVGADAALLANRIRGRARDAGVLVETLEAARSGSVIRVKLGFSGSEQAVIALADTIEREPRLLRLAEWRIAPIEGGVRLTGVALGAVR